PPRSTLFPYTTLFRSLEWRTAPDTVTKETGAQPARASNCWGNPPAPSRAVAVTLARRQVLPASTVRLDTVRGAVVVSWLIPLVRSEEHTSELQSLRHL